MDFRSWTRVGNIGALLVVVGFAGALLQLPGAGVVGPWLLVLGFGAAIASIFGRVSARRRSGE